MTPEQYIKQVRLGYSQIPVTRDLLADMDTPLSVYKKIADEPYTYLLESADGHEKWGRYSYIGLQATDRISITGNQVMLHSNGLDTTETTDSPLAFLQQYIKRFSVAPLPSILRFPGGLVGYISYDSVRYVEKHLQQSMPKNDELGVPDVLLMRSERLVVFDNYKGTLTLICYANSADSNGYDTAQTVLDHMEKGLLESQAKCQDIMLTDAVLDESALASSLGKEGYMAAVEKIKEYCIAGDAMQVVPSQRLSMDYAEEPISLYRALRLINPSPYMYFFNFSDFQIVGASPEILARLQDNQVTVRPIAGTRRRGKTAEDDLAMEHEMLSDPKEIAEHLMLIDLGRNDAGRVSQTGTVKVTEQMVVERYSHVMHISSNVVGQLKPGLDAIDVLKAVHPAGTLSGAPKVRAMEIIDEIEQVKRSLYGGAVGYIGYNGVMDMAIAIRTGVIKNKRLYVQAGGGCVVDSKPELEWEETMNKARALLRAAAMVQASAGKKGTKNKAQDESEKNV